MKVVLASTPEQENKITYLVDYFYTDIFPLFFNDEDIKKFEKMNFLCVTDKSDLTGTLKESYQIISSLEILIFLIESDSMYKEQYQIMFNKNAKILNELGITFPFTFEQFIEKSASLFEEGSIFVKAANNWLV